MIASDQERKCLWLHWKVNHPTAQCDRFGAPTNPKPNTRWCAMLHPHLIPYLMGYQFKKLVSWCEPNYFVLIIVMWNHLNRARRRRILDFSIGVVSDCVAVKNCYSRNSCTALGLRRRTAGEFHIGAVCHLTSRHIDYSYYRVRQLLVNNHNNIRTSREDMGGDIFFPFLPVGSQHHHQHHHGPTERYYEALQAAAIGTSYYKRKKTPIPILPPPPPSSNQNNNSHHHLNNKKQQQYQAVSDVLIQQSSSNGAGVGGKVPVEPGKIPQTPMMTTTMANGSVPYRHNSSNELSHQSTITRLMSPPVPALLKKLKIANGEALTDAEVVGVNGGEWQDYDDSGTFKISKELENLHIKTDTSRHTTTIVSEQDKKDLLFRLSLLKQVWSAHMIMISTWWLTITNFLKNNLIYYCRWQGLEKKKTALDAMSQVSSQWIHRTLQFITQFIKKKK